MTYVEPAFALDACVGSKESKTGEVDLEENVMEPFADVFYSPGPQMGGDVMAMTLQKPDWIEDSLGYQRPTITHREDIMLSPNGPTREAVLWDNGLISIISKVGRMEDRLEEQVYRGRLRSEAVADLITLDEGSSIWHKHWPDEEDPEEEVSSRRREPPWAIIDRVIAEREAGIRMEGCQERRERAAHIEELCPTVEEAMKTVELAEGLGLGVDKGSKRLLEKVQAGIEMERKRVRSE